VANPINSEFERSLRIDTPNLLTSLLKELMAGTFFDREIGSSGRASPGPRNCPT
jgi:hypothetical protein